MAIKNFKIIIIAALLCLSAWPATAENNLAQKLSGRILLQVESKGEAWYVNPADLKRYFLGRPDDALALMRQLALGVTNANLNKLPLGLLNYSGADDDSDGLPNSLEQVIGTNPKKADSDNDGYDDKTEISNNYNPLDLGQIAVDKNLQEQLSGRILLQVESYGAGWYLSPVEHKKYYLGRPLDAWEVMRRLALGITDKNLAQITISQFQPASTTPVELPQNPPQNETSILDQAAANIRSNNSTAAQSNFIESMRKSIGYSMEHLSADSRLLLANILSSAKLTSSSQAEKIYSTTAYFSLGGYEVPLNFHVKKQTDGKWLMVNL